MRLRSAIALLALMAVSACASRSAFRPPSGDVIKDDGLAQRFAAARAERCDGIPAITAEIGVSGRVDGKRIRGRLHVGATRQGWLRIEGVAPFGAPIFTFVSRNQDQAELWLPRTREFVNGSAKQILAVLTGAELRPESVFAILTGCPGAGNTLTFAGRYDDRAYAAAVMSDAVIFYVRQNPISPVATFVIDASALAEYDRFVGSQPSRVRLTAPQPISLAEKVGPLRADVRLTLSDVDIRQDLASDVFQPPAPRTGPEPKQISVRELADRLR